MLVFWHQSETQVSTPSIEASGKVSSRLGAMSRPRRESWNKSQGARFSCLWMLNVKMTPKKSNCFLSKPSNLLPHSENAMPELASPGRVDVESLLGTVAHVHIKHSWSRVSVYVANASQISSLLHALFLVSTNHWGGNVWLLSSEMLNYLYVRTGRLMTAGCLLPSR